MNVLFIATYEGLSGASYSLLGMIEELRLMGINPHVILLKDGKLRDELKNRDISFDIVRGYPWVVDHLKRNSVRQNLLWAVKSIYNQIAERKILKIIRDKKIDILHINAFTASVGFIAAKRAGIPVVWHIREFVEEDLNKCFWNKKAALRKLEFADTVIAISESVKNKYSRLAPYAKIHVIYNGISIAEYKDGRSTPALSNSNVSVILAGRIDPGKGHKEVIEAFYEIGIENLKGIALKIAGKSQSKEYEEEIRGLIKQRGLDNIIEIIGFRSDLPKIYKESDIAIVSSKAEAFGRVTVEAVMGGCLVLGADTAGTKEIIGREYGLLYKQGDSHDLAKKLIQILDDKNRFRIVANKGREYALNTFTAMNNAEKVLKVYKQLIIDLDG